MELFTHQSFCKIAPTEDAQAFFDYLEYPSWFKIPFQPRFDMHRQEQDGTIYLLKSEADHVIGCIYVELSPNHLSFGKKSPIFGWLQADSEELCHALLHLAQYVTMQAGFTSIRGPINEPSDLGGYGVCVENQLPQPLVYCSQTPAKYARWITSAGFSECAKYVSVEATNTYDRPNPFPHVEIVDESIGATVQNPALLEQLAATIAANFKDSLPDTTLHNKMQATIAQLLQMDRGEEFYIIARDTLTGEIAGFALEIPNVFDAWQHRPITSADIDTAIVNPKYRNADFFSWMFFQMVAKLRARGVVHQIGSSVWTKNYRAMRSFSKISTQLAKYQVFRHD